jgi:regulator of protease activity HflC (stomatin/prohibitin superfamily)
MVYHIPSSEIPFVKLLIVKEYERGVFLRDGQLYAVLPPGRWFLGRMPIVGRMELIWVDMGITKLPYGLRTLTQDGVEIGANGVVYVRVTDPERFIVNLVTGRSIFTTEDLQQFLKDQVIGILRAEMAHYDVRSIYVEREMFITVARVNLQEMLSDLGLEFRALEVAGFLLPDEVRGALQTPMIAARQAEATVTTGAATAQVLTQIRNAGVDPIKYKAVEALMKYAQTRSTGSDAGSTQNIKFGGDLLMPLVFFGLLMKDTSLPSTLKDQLKTMFPQFSDTPPPHSQSPPSTPSTPSITEYTPERVQAILDGLDERLAQGEISEDLYRQLRAKWEARHTPS